MANPDSCADEWAGQLGNMARASQAEVQPGVQLRLFDRSVWSSRKAEIWVWPYYLVMVTVSDYGNYVTVASRQVLLS